MIRTVASKCPSWWNQGSASCSWAGSSSTHRYTIFHITLYYTLSSVSYSFYHTLSRFSRSVYHTLPIQSIIPYDTLSHHIAHHFSHALKSASRWESSSFPYEITLTNSLLIYVPLWYYSSCWAMWVWMSRKSFKCLFDLCHPHLRPHTVTSWHHAAPHTHTHTSTHTHASMRAHPRTHRNAPMTGRHAHRQPDNTVKHTAT